MNPPEKIRVVHNAYCRIPLKLMAEFAEKNGITIKPALEIKATETINAFPELTKLESRIRAHIAQVGPHGSKPEHWQMADPELNAIRHKHLHFSARYNTVFGHNPRRSFFSGERKRYESDG